MKKILVFILLSIYFIPSLYSESITKFSLKKINGDDFNISEHLGSKVILIDFWATWCKPCKKMLKKLNDIQKKLNENLLILAISTDDSSSFSRIENYIKSKKYRFTVLLDPESRISNFFNPGGQIPFTMIIDKSGKIRYTHTGYIPGIEKDFEKIISRILDEK